MLAHPDHVPRHVPALSALVEENGFLDWLIDAEPGETLVYYRGHLSHDRMPSVSALTDLDSRKLSDVANRVLSTESMGLVIPVQRRVAHSSAHARPRPVDLLKGASKSIKVAPGINASGVIKTLADVMVFEGAPIFNRPDNDSEMAVKVLQQCSSGLATRSFYIEPGSIFESSDCRFSTASSGTNC